MSITNIKGILLLLLTLTLIACEKKAEREKIPEANVTLATVTSKTVPYLIHTVGNTIANYSVDIMPQVSGELTGFYFKEGGLIKKGDLLFTIDSQPYTAALQQAKGELEQSQASFRYNKERVERYQDLLPEDYVSLLDFAQYVSGMETAKGQITQFEGAVEEAMVNVEYCTIHSPLEGVCGRYGLDPGNIVTPSQQTPLLTIKQIRPIFALFTVAGPLFLEIEKHQKKSPAGLTVEMQVPGEGKKPVFGKIDMIDNTVDTATGTLLLRAFFPNEDRSIWPGQFVNISIHLYTIPDALIVPKKAVRMDTKGHFLFVAKEDGTVEQRRLTLGQSFDQEQVILKGVNKGEQVVTRGQLSLYPGAKYVVHTEKKEELEKTST